MFNDCSREKSDKYIYIKYTFISILFDILSFQSN